MSDAVRRAFRLGVGRAHLADEVDDEVRFHIEMRAQHLIADGWAPDAARAQATKQFGDVSAVRADCLSIDHQRDREMRRANILDEFRQDLGYGLRTLRRSPGFATIVIATLALGIGANTAIFTLIDAVLLRPLDVAHPEQLVAVGNPVRVGSLSEGTPIGGLFSVPLYRDIRDEHRFVTGLLASGRTGRMDVTIGTANPGDEAEHPRGRLVSANYFSVLGVPLSAGRGFTPADDGAAGTAPVVVISYGYWMRRFAGDAATLGSTIRINDGAYTIVGIGPPRFTGEIVGVANDIWIPLNMEPALMAGRNWLDDRSEHWLLFMGRLAPGVTLDQATAGLEAIVRRAYESPVYASGPAVLAPGQAEKMQIFVEFGARGFSRVRASFRTPLFTLMAGVALLLLIVCANVANLLLARAVARDREMSVRLALGAGRRRLVRQLITESTTLALGGAALGLLVAWWGSRLLLALASAGPTPLPIDVHFDLPTLAFTAAVALVTVGLFGLAPAIRATGVDLATSMRASTRALGGGFGGNRLPFAKILIASQVALSLLLLVSTALLVRSLEALEHVDVGLDRDRLLVVQVDPDPRRYGGARQPILVHALVERIASVAGVKAVSVSENGLFSGSEQGTYFQASGFTPHDASDTVAAYDHVGPEYFHTIGARMLAGRGIENRDDERAPQVAVLNETLARFVFGQPEAAVGKELLIGKARIPIVGVVADARDHDLTSPPVRRLYVPFFHPLGVPGTMRLEVRADGDPAKLVRPVRGAIAEVDPALRVLSADPLAVLMSESLTEERLVTRLALGFGVIALLLSAIGLYGVMSYSIARRTGEIGLRIALGAQPAEVLRLVFGEAFRLVALGVAVGLPLAYGAARLLRGQLHGVEATDPVAIGVAVGVLATSAALAVGMPAWRAARVPPLVALRQE